MMTLHSGGRTWTRFVILAVVVTSTPSRMNSAAGAPLIIPLTQSRTVSASASAEGEFGGSASDHDSDSAPDFGPFSASVSARAFSDGTASATASHASNILDTQITGVGTANVSAVGTLAGVGTASASSLLSFGFEISEPVAYRFDGELLSGFSGFAPVYDGMFRLTGPGDHIVFLEQLQFDRPSVSLIASGELTPGTYGLEARINTSAGSCCGDGGTSSHASFDIAFHVIPEPRSILLLMFGMPLLFIVYRERRSATPASTATVCSVTNTSA